ncbi:hypothetical protein [Rhodospirillum rubrum]|uniref:DUF4157 domain-containing protein n=1 Tax=Rhodospirillum rubrum (strain ATCC 11170 / ATH 1.1.1 / DSM 467 / LMG 4362 / NCIMB 8255 / S1) TaxID=269796 RepID=Q2RTG2_RHORT|nr:hypothetical protein [Rhodospirillum rubrum]ABC22583.1 hypothetical protein Rru_A1783 [Rhodospirillum rubrum ATCC 11170]AEO48301.1 hypothetical protein F11_09175 [Rhodospirillum rubrum F11]MBK5954172.1 hypothetical protein [Rhodospirillum rubrum]QXG82208.1 hypothetical protein KUL73_09230 [Rhodospirillum rubrum]HAP99409.1 hypothetical protein [Rhodospirillum rubrum]
MALLTTVGRRALRMVVPVLAVFWALAPPQALAAGDCAPASEQPKVVLVSGFGPVRQNFTRSGEDLAALLRQRAGAAGRPVGHTVGLTDTRLDYQYSTRVRAVPIAEGGVCAYLLELSIRLRYPLITVYVAREYRRDSCPFRTALEHEYGHVARYRQGYEGFLPVIKAAALQAIALNNPLRVASMAQAREAHVERLRAVFDPLLETFNAEQRRRNLDLDTPENYARERARCPDW